MFVSEMGAFINNRARMSTAILRYPSGRFGIVGSVPGELTEIRPRQGDPYSHTRRVSKVWDTEAEVVAALLAIGVTRFQMADCSWYGEAASRE